MDAILPTPLLGVEISKRQNILCQGDMEAKETKGSLTKGQNILPEKHNHKGLHIEPK